MISHATSYPLHIQLIFADRINQRLYVTTDEGDTYTRHDIPFTPDRLRFQSIYSPHSNDSNLSQYVLGYDATNRTVSAWRQRYTTWRESFFLLINFSGLYTHQQMTH